MEDFSDHPKFLELMRSEFEDKESIQRGFHTYLTLCEVHSWWNVEVHVHTEEGVILCSGHPVRGQAREFVVSWDPDKPISHREIQKYFPIIQKHHSKACNELLVALVTCDSTIAFYKMSAGLVPLPLVEEKRNLPLRKRRQFTYPNTDEMKIIHQEET